MLVRYLHVAGVPNHRTQGIGQTLKTPSAYHPRVRGHGTTTNHSPMSPTGPVVDAPSAHGVLMLGKRESMVPATCSTDLRHIPEILRTGHLQAQSFDCGRYIPRHTYLAFSSPAEECVLVLDWAETGSGTPIPHLLDFKVYCLQVCARGLAAVTRRPAQRQAR